MRMDILIVVVIMAMAEFIAHTLAATLDDMYQMMLLKQGEGTEDVRLVDTQNLIF